MQITLVLSAAPRQVHEWPLQVPHPCNVQRLLEQVDWVALCGSAPAKSFEVSIWGRHAEGTSVLKNGDRVELTRPLRVDPKVARRERFQRQGVRTAGLFARRTKP